MSDTETILVSEGPAEDTATYEPALRETAREDAAQDQKEPTAKEVQEEWNPEQVIRKISLRLQR